VEHLVTFSNPAGNAVAAASGYVQALLELLGDRDPLEVLNGLDPWLDERTNGLGDTVLRKPEAPGKWSVVEVIQHLADSELVVGFRMRMMLTADRPALQGFDQDLWARELGYRSAQLDIALRQLRGLRIPNVRLARTLSARQLDRIGVHSERGPESVGHLLKLMAAHDLVHRRQIDRILVSVGRT
jgi:hypothetical protein